MSNVFLLSILRVGGGKQGVVMVSVLYQNENLEFCIVSQIRTDDDATFWL